VIAAAEVENGSGAQLTFPLCLRKLLNETHADRRDPTNSLPSPFTGSRSNVLGDYGNFNAPRTYGIEASIKF
jgi:iron complex outermembrane receptor protein